MAAVFRSATTIAPRAPAYRTSLVGTASREAIVAYGPSCSVASGTPLSTCTMAAGPAPSLGGFISGRSGSTCRTATRRPLGRAPLSRKASLVVSVASSSSSRTPATIPARWRRVLAFRRACRPSRTSAAGSTRPASFPGSGAGCTDLSMRHRF